MVEVDEVDVEERDVFVVEGFVVVVVVVTTGGGHAPA